MIIGNETLRLIRQQKARAKLSEFNVDKNDYPAFSNNLDELLLPTHFSLFKYCVCVFDKTNDEETKKDLIQAYEYFESSSRDININEIEPELCFFGAVSSFVMGNFASSKVLFSNVVTNSDEPLIKRLLDKFIKNLFGSYDEYYLSNHQLDKIVGNYFNGNLSFDEFDKQYKEQEPLYATDYDNFVYYYYLYAVVCIYEDNRASKILPCSSKASLEQWESYLRRKDSIRIL